MNKIKIKISFFGGLMVAALILTHSYLSLAALLAAAIHECGHILAARVCKISLCEMRLGIFGASLSTSSGLCSYKKEIFLAAAGPFFNFLTVALFYPIIKNANDFSELFLAASLFLGILNLLPIADLDGGRILYCFICQKGSPKVASAVCSTLSFLCVICLWLLSVYLLLRRSSSLSLFVFSISLFAKIFIKQKN